jgi:hypothetical protein
MDMALNVKMSMQFTDNNWQSFLDSPIIYQPKFIDVIEFEVEIPATMFQVNKNP